MDLKNLDKIIALCRKRGVSEITIEGVTVKLGDAPGKKTPRKSTNLGNFSGGAENVETDGLSDMDLLLWSSTPLVTDENTNEN